jgi:hypothetical protein
MKVLTLGVVTASLLLTPAAVAKGKRDQSSSQQGIAVLTQALNNVATTTQSSGPPARTEDRDQGDDHANAGAILQVCSKDTPAARRSAICPVSLSPQ